MASGWDVQKSATVDAAGNASFKGLLQSNAYIFQVQHLLVTSLSSGGSGTLSVGGKIIGPIATTRFGALESFPVNPGQEVELVYSGCVPGDIITAHFYGLLLDPTKPGELALAIFAPGIPNTAVPPEAQHAIVGAQGGATTTTLVAPAPTGSSLVIYRLLILSRKAAPAGFAQFQDQAGNTILLSNPNLAAAPNILECNPGITQTQVVAAGGTGLTQGVTITSLLFVTTSVGDQWDGHAIYAYQ